MGADADALAGAVGEWADWTDADLDGDEECDELDALVLRGGRPTAADFAIWAAIWLS